MLQHEQCEAWAERLRNVTEFSRLFPALCGHEPFHVSLRMTCQEEMYAVEYLPLQLFREFVCPHSTHALLHNTERCTPVEPECTVPVSASNHKLRNPLAVILSVVAVDGTGHRMREHAHPLCLRENTAVYFQDLSFHISCRYPVQFAPDRVARGDWEESCPTHCFGEAVDEPVCHCSQSKNCRIGSLRIVRIDSSRLEIVFKPNEPKTS